MPDTLTAVLLDENGTELRRVAVVLENGAAPQWLRIAGTIEATQQRVTEVYLHQSSSRADLPIYIWQFDQGVDTGKRLRANPSITQLSDFEEADDGPNSYEWRANAKED